MPISGAELARRALQGAQEGIEEGAELVLAESRDLAPVESGTLKASGRMSGGGLNYDVSYHTVYAAAQHEGHAIMNKGGPDSPYLWQVRNGGRPKYLEDALKGNSGRIAAVTAAEVRKYFG